MLPIERSDIKGTLKKKELCDNWPLTGGHTRENALFYINRKLDSSSPNIVDIGVTVLSLLGIDTGTLDRKPLAGEKAGVSRERE